MKKITTHLTNTKHGFLTLSLTAALLLLSSGCSQKSEDQKTTISVNLPPEVIAQASANPSSIDGDLTGVASIIITVYDNNDGARTTQNPQLYRGDIFAAGGTLKFEVLPYTDLYITGDARNGIDGTGTQLAYGETTINGLKPGSNVGVAFTLQSVVAAKPVSGIITTGGSLGTIAPGTVVQVLEVVDGTESLLGEGVVTDANGTYTLNVANDLNPASNIIFRVLVDNNSETPMDARYTAPSVNINPVTHAASQLVSRLVTVAETTLDTVSVQEIIEMERTLNLIALDEGARSDLTFQQYAVLLTQTLEADLQTAYVAGSAVASGEICGTVTDSTGAGLAGITMIVRNFNNELLRGRSETAADGSYCVNVPVAGASDPLVGDIADGDYIIGALNRGETSFAASQWWTSTGGESLRIRAGKISLVETATATADFSLPDGTRIQGTVSATSTAEPIAGVNVMVRDKTTQFLLVGDVSDANGDYVLNVPVGDYIVEARNNSSQPFATESFTSDGAGTANRNLASVLSPQLSVPLTADFSLDDGELLSVNVTELDAMEIPQPVTGVRMYINYNGGAATRSLVTKRDGSYQVWLQPGFYDLFGYGQRAVGVDLTQGPLAAPLEFSATVARLPVVVQHNGNNVAGVKLRLWEANEGPVSKNVDFSKSDGTAIMYAQISGVSSHLIEARVEGRENFAAHIYQGQMMLGDGNSIALTTGTTAPEVTVTLPDAGWLTGSVLDMDGNPVSNALVSVFPATFPGSYSRFVFTRTSGDGRFELSLPQGTYNAIRVSAYFGNVDCRNVPVLIGDTTELLVEDSGDGVFCNFNQTPPTLRSLPGSVTLNGLDSVFNNAQVQLMEIDAAGNQVGDAVSFGTVQSGIFNLAVPESLAAESRYIASVQTATGQVLRAHLTNQTSLDLSPVSTVTSSMVLNYSNINEVSATEIVEIERTLREVELAYDMSNATTLVDYLGQLETNFLADLETANILTSSFGLGTICGLVQDNSNTQLAGISIEVRDFNTEILRARTVSDSSGNYCVNVPLTGSQDPVSTQLSDGEYIVGAINRTDTSFAASEWWTAAGNGYSRIKGEKITVPSETNVIADFTLEPGARVFGQIEALNNLEQLVAVPGVKVSIRDSITHFLLAGHTAQQDGSFRINVYPGDYIIEVRNSTFRPYASGTFTSPGSFGSNILHDGSVIPLTAGDSSQVDMMLSSSAVLLSGRVAVGADPTTGLGGAPVTGVPVIVNLGDFPSIGGVILDSAPVARMRVTNLDGNYGIWLAYDVYQVFTYGQSDFANMLQLPHHSIFAATVSELPVTTLHNSNPVGGTKLRLHAQTEGYEYWGEAITRSDGTTTLYSDFSGSHAIEARIEEAAPYGSIYYGGAQQIWTANSVVFTPELTATGITIDLPDAGILTGTIAFFGGTPIPNAIVIVSSGNDYFVATRTNANGNYRLSLPESVYDPAQVYRAGFSSTCFNIDSGIPVILNVTTEMNAFTGDGTECDIIIPPLTLGSITPVTFDRSFSHDPSYHSLRMPTSNSWPMSGYDPLDGSLNAATRSFRFSEQILNGVPVTVTTETLNGVDIETQALAVGADRAIYTLYSQNDLGTIEWSEPFLYLPASITADTLPWPTPDGGTNTVIGENVQSPAGYTGTIIHIETTYPQEMNIPPWNTYIRTFDGIVDEWEDLGAGSLYYRRTDLTPQNPPVGGGAVP